MNAPNRRLQVAVVSHAAIIAANQEPFAALEQTGLDVSIIAPSSLRTDLRGTLALERSPSFEGRILGLRLAFGGYSRRLGGQRGIHLITYRELGPALRELDPDVVFVEEEPYSFAAGQVWAWTRRHRIPFVVHQNQNLDRRLPPPFEVIRGRVVHAAAGATVRNPAAEDVLRAHAFTGPVIGFPHAIDPSRYGRTRRRTGLPSPVVGFVGRLVEEKGIIELVDALANLRRRGPMSLLVIGDGPLRDTAERRAKAGGLQAEFLGAVSHDDVPGWYSAMDLVVIPSRPTQTWTEQFGRVILEANASGVCVLSSDAGELPSTLSATGGGIAYALDDPDGLRKGLERLVLDGRERAGLAEIGREGVSAHFTHEVVARDLARLLREVAG